MIRKRSVFAPALLASLGLAVAMLGPTHAQTPKLNVKLGLWEATTVAQTSGTLPIDTSGMTPERRAQIEAMAEKLKAHSAMPHTFRTCLTAEKLEKNPFEDKSNSCKDTVVSSSPTEYDVKFDCANGDAGSTNGEWRFEALTPELVKGNGEFTMERAGHKMDATSTMTAKWVADSCGNVR